MSLLEVDGSKLWFLEILLLCLSFVASFRRFYHTTEVFLVVKMVDDENLLNNKTIILLNLAEYPLILPTQPTASSAKYQVIFRAILQDNC